MQYKISNKKIEIKINQKGAELCSLKKVDSSYEYIWQANEKYWNRSAPVLFPIVGKLIDDTYTYKDKSYKMSQHGFARDKNFELFEQSENIICFMLTHDSDTLKIYPFEFELYISYALVNNSVEVTYKIVNKTKGEMYFSIGGHPAFNCDEVDYHNNNLYFEFEDLDVLQSYVITPKGICQDKIKLELASNKLFLSQDLFKNDALIIDDLKSKCVSLKNSKNDRFVSVHFESCDYLGLWSKDACSLFVCIEPWNGVADFVNHNQKLEEKNGIKKLKPSEVYNTKYTIYI